MQNAITLVKESEVLSQIEMLTMFNDQQTIILLTAMAEIAKIKVALALGDDPCSASLAAQEKAAEWERLSDYLMKLAAAKRAKARPLGRSFMATNLC